MKSNCFSRKICYHFRLPPISAELLKSFEAFRHNSFLVFLRQSETPVLEETPEEPANVEMASPKVSPKGKCHSPPKGKGFSPPGQKGRSGKGKPLFPTSSARIPPSQDFPVDRPETPTIDLDSESDAGSPVRQNRRRTGAPALEPTRWVFAF